MTPFDSLRTKLTTLAHLRSALIALEWDQEVMMPSKAAASRAQTLGELSGLLHDMFLSLNENNLLEGLKQDLDNGSLDDKQTIIIRELWCEYSREQKLPTEFVRTLAELTSEAQGVWAKARAASDFKLFEPALEKIVALKQEEAKLVGYTQSPYDALLDQFEPGANAHEIALLFADLKDFLVPLLHTINRANAPLSPNLISGTFPLEKQKQFNRTIAHALGFDFDAGRIDESTHPFATGFHPTDVRITTRYNQRDVLYSVMSTIHEVGHALYEQGLPSEYFGTGLAEAISLGIHESQSRMWENMIGRSLPFWHHFYPTLSQTFPKPFRTLPIESFYRAINHVEPSLIRTEADEVTYNLHIIIRFEIEKELIEGTIAVKDLPELWHAKYKEYLGVDVPDDARGVLQDIHWSMGGIGYFPTYTLGNLYAAQFFAALQKALPVEELIQKGEFAPIVKWLRENIHIHGKYYSANKLCEHVTGEALSSHYFEDYLSKKYTQLYALK